MASIDADRRAKLEAFTAVTNLKSLITVTENIVMFGFLKKDPVKKLQQQYTQLLEEAMQQQRKGDIKAYSDITAKAEDVMRQITELEKG